MPAVVDCLDLLFSDVTFPLDQWSSIKEFLWVHLVCVHVCVAKGPHKTRSELPKLVDAT